MTPTAFRRSPAGARAAVVAGGGEVVVIVEGLNRLPTDIKALEHPRRPPPAPRYRRTPETGSNRAGRRACLMEHRTPEFVEPSKLNEGPHLASLSPRRLGSCGCERRARR